MNLKAFALGFALMLPLAIMGTAEAAPALPEGTVDVGSESVLEYGGSVTFDVTVTGRVQKQAEIYILVVCWQGVERIDPVVYQWSSHNLDFVFPLAKQPGLEWNGQAADCQANLYYKVNGPRGSSTFTTLDSVRFGVTA